MTEHSLYLADLFPRASLQASRVKLIRYNLNDPGAGAAGAVNLLFEYAQLQKPKFYEKIDYVLVFITAKGDSAKFIGCYSTTYLELSVSVDLFPKAFPIELLRNPTNVFHPLEKTSLFKDLENRLYIDWNTTKDIWYQTALIDKPILYIKNSDKYVYEGAQSILLTYKDLQEILSDPLLYSSWHKALRTMSAIYLITDLEEGTHFIGASYAPHNLLETWAYFTEDVSGGFDGISHYLASRPQRFKSFQFSILQVLPSMIEAEDVQLIIELYKRKLGKKATVIL
ncbi:hypothetical protein [Kurthia sibirica]|uniref:Uncharacterized protein n=1 Tax=Kurthia sibirica TaxID=202750 RepID=A0A2U3AN06_9BACL|nr:hypothetical protein [Kurthia sibirica]PWI25907.1 hypothetical protein DEX24_05070 [Kurthia sibirica]GEK34259.1 hypothetical protein KSI01_17920 [Kurthia sibirica]